MPGEQLKNGIRLSTASWVFALLALVPLVVVLACTAGPFKADALQLFGGIDYGVPRKLVEAQPTIEGNYAATSQALGTRAALDVLAGRLPLWNHYEGLGAPLLGEMQSAALFPPTWLMALPHGQILEQALLQVVAGLGTFLFFRAFGVGRRAALAGAVTFEVNGVYAWLRNAIFNPVAFLPWLFLVIERIRAGAVAGLPLRRRLPTVVLGACTAALSLYAGFPEEVYFYGLLLIVWTLFRVATLSRRQMAAFALDILLIGCAALALSAPLLAAFADYLKVAELGSHGGDGFAGVWLEGSALLQYLLPYVYGPIFRSPDPAVIGVWSGIGGYIGFVPVALAFASLATPRRRAAKLVLAGWIVIALGVTQGLPGVYGAFNLLPFAAAAASFRYLNASWIFCFVALSVFLLDDASTLSRAALRRAVLIGVAAALGCVLLATAAAWTTLASLWAASNGRPTVLLLTAVGVLALAAAVGGATRLDLRRSSAVLSLVLVAEAVALFGVPFLSYPRAGKIDVDLIDFLRGHAGTGRVLDVDGGLLPNYGSAFGFALLNYNDLPSPRLTHAFVKETLDPYADAISFNPWMPPGLSAEEQADRSRQVLARLPDAARAGVAYVVAPRGFGETVPLDLGRGETGSTALEPGGRIDIPGVANRDRPFAVSAVSPLLGPGTAATGSLTAEVCVEADCARGSIDLAALGSDATPSIPLDRRMVVDAGARYTVRLGRGPGSGPLVLPVFPVPAAPARPAAGSEPERPLPATAPKVLLRDGSLRLAYRGQTLDVLALRDPRAYLSADGCELRPASRDSVETSCAKPSRLLRLELTMDGWSARIDGVPAGITTADGVFQAIDLPAGRRQVTFSYAPRWFEPAFATAVIAMLVLLVAGIDGIRSAARRGSPRW